MFYFLRRKGVYWATFEGNLWQQRRWSLDKIDSKIDEEQNTNNDV